MSRKRTILCGSGSVIWLTKGSCVAFLGGATQTCRTRFKHSNGKTKGPWVPLDCRCCAALLLVLSPFPLPASAYPFVQRSVGCQGRRFLGTHVASVSFICRQRRAWSGWHHVSQACGFAPLRTRTCGYISPRATCCNWSRQHVCRKVAGGYRPASDCG